jgi:DNA-binding NtrC family response regulator
VDIRVVAATHVDLEAAVAAGSFREDLYYRLNVIPLRVPPLRERGGDIALLARHFLAQFSAAQEKEAPSVSPEFWDALERYEWPGNVRELRNLAERLIVLDEDGRITLSDLPEPLRPGIDPVARALAHEPISYERARSEALRDLRSTYLKHLLEANGGNISKAARGAGISRRTLHRWLADSSHPVGTDTEPE